MKNHAPFLEYKLWCHLVMRCVCTLLHTDIRRHGGYCAVVGYRPQTKIQIWRQTFSSIAVRCVPATANRHHMPADRPTIAVNQKHGILHGKTWYTMVNPMVYHGTTAMCYNTVVPWHIIVYRCVHNDIPWCAMVRPCSNTSQSYSGTPWYTTVRLRCVVTLSYHDIQWYTVYTIHHGTDVTIIEIEIVFLTEHRIESKSYFSCIPSNDLSIEALDGLLTPSRFNRQTTHCSAGGCR